MQIFFFFCLQSLDDSFWLYPTWRYRAPTTQSLRIFIGWNIHFFLPWSFLPPSLFVSVRLLDRRTYRWVRRTGSTWLAIFFPLPTTWWSLRWNSKCYVCKEEEGVGGRNLFSRLFIPHKPSQISPPSFHMEQQRIFFFDGHIYFYFFL